MNRIACLCVALSSLVFHNANAAIFGYTLTKSDKGSKVEAKELADPYADYTLLPESLWVDDQLSDIPGRIVVKAQSGKDVLLLAYAEFVFKDDAKIPEIKTSDFEYDSYLLDTQSAATVGVPAAALQVSGDYKVEFRFYTGGVTRMNLRDIDRRKFNDAVRRIRADIARQPQLKILSIEIISSAAALHSAYAVIQGVKSDANVSGAGWQIGGKFYASQQMTKKRKRIGIATVPFAEDVIVGEKAPTEPAVNPVLKGLAADPAAKVKPESLGLKPGGFQEIIKVDSRLE